MLDVAFFPYKRVMGPFATFLITLALVLSPLMARSQEHKETRSSDDDEILKVSSNLVSLDVTVKDKKGRIITDLNAEDFIVSENGVQQSLAFFDSTLSSTGDPGQPTAVGAGPGPRSPAGFPRNIISLVLDGQTTEGLNLKPVRDGIVKYIRERISDNDAVALFAISGGGLQMVQPFTQDKAQLIAAAENAYGSSSASKTAEQQNITENIAALRSQLATMPTGPITNAAAGSGAARAMISRRVLEQYVHFRSVLSLQQTRPILASLAAICEGLRPIPGKKTLVMFSQGFVAPATLDWQVQSTIDIANRANVAIYIIDSSGLTGGTPQSGALVPTSALSGISAETSQEQRIRAGAGESVFDIARHEGLNRQQDLLYRISGDTGGRFVKNTNDIAAGLDRIDSEIRARYTLSYRSSNPNFDGSFRKVKVEVRRADATVVTRPGYYAIPPTQIVPLSPEDRKFLASFETIEAHSTLPLALQLNSFRAQQDTYIVPLSFEIPPAAVESDRKGDKRRLRLDVLGVVRAEGDDRILSRLGGNFDVELTTEQFNSIVNDKIFYRQDMQLGAGTYMVDLLVKDLLSGRAAAKRTKLVLAETNSVFSATDAVLSRHAEPLSSTAGAGDVLSAGKVLIRPSPSREFESTDNLIIFFKLYNAAPAPETGKPLVRVTVTLMKDGAPVTKPIDYELSDTYAEPVPHLVFAKYIKLAGLSKGKYSAVIEANDMVQKKTLKQESGFVITR